MELTKRLYNLWELESIGIKQEESSVLELFKETITLRNQRYKVGLPWEEAHDPLPDNHSLRQRLQSFLKRLSQMPEQLEYDRVIKDQLDKGIIERVDQSEKTQPCHQIHYLPHHCVVREDKSTTKLRIVNNALARKNGSPSIDCLHTRPPLTPDILEILIRFSVQPIAIVAGIEKAFLKKVSWLRNGSQIKKKQEKWKMYLK